MIKAVRPKRLKSFQDKYLALALIVAASFLGANVQAQSGFPTTDSLHRYNNRYIKNTPVEAFANLRLNTLLHGIIAWIDTARLGGGGAVAIGIDTVYLANDSTLRFSKNGYDFDIVIPSPLSYTFSAGLGSYDGNPAHIGIIGGDNIRIHSDSVFRIYHGDVDGAEPAYSFYEQLTAGISNAYYRYVDGVSEVQVRTGAEVATARDGTDFTERAVMEAIDFTSNQTHRISVYPDGIFVDGLTPGIGTHNVQWDEISKKLMVNSDVGTGGTTENFGYGITGTGEFATPREVDSTVIALKTDLTLDSIGRVEGRDSIDFYRSGVKIASIKDSTGGVGTGDNWGTQGALTDGFFTGTGKVGDTLRLDSAELYTEVLSRIPNAPFPDFFSGSGITITGNDVVGYTFTNSGNPGSNPRQAYSILNYGGAGDAVIGSGSVPTSGTDNTPALNTMFSTLPDGSVIYLPGGGRKYWFKTVPDTVNYNKKFYFIADGDIYNINTSGQGIDFLIIRNPSGPQEQSRWEFRGNCYGKINMVSHSKAAHDAGTGPVWSSFTGTLVKIYNTFQQHVEINKAEGYQQPVNLIATAGGGTQENTIIIRWAYKNANGITMQSLNGFSFVDKNHIWMSRVSGGLGIKIDGYATPVDHDGNPGTTAEPFNGAFRSNDFHVLIEAVDSVMEAHGDITENLFDVNIEGGSSTGLFGAVAFRMRSVSPNFVRNPWYTGRGVYSIHWLQNGMGLDAKGDVPVYDSQFGRYFSNKWRTDANGVLIFEGSKLSKTQRDNYTSYNLLYSPGATEVVYKSITASTYTAVAGEVIQYANATGTITAPAANANIARRFTVQNIHGSAAVTISGVANYTSIPAGDNMTWESNGTTWMGVVNAEGTGGGGGTDHFTDDTYGATTTFKLGIRTASVNGAAFAFPASTNSVASYALPDGVIPTTPIDGAHWRIGSRVFFEDNANTYEYLTAPDNGSARQAILRNVANDGLEYKYVDRVQYSNTSSIIATGANSSSKTSITGGTVTVDPLNTGDIIVIRGAGIIQTAASGTVQPTFDYLLNSTASIFNTGTLLNSSVYYYQYTINVVAGGNSSVELKISKDGNTAPLVYFVSGSSSGLNLSAPTVNVRAWFTTSGNQTNADVSTVKVERK